MKQLFFLLLLLFLMTSLQGQTFSEKSRLGRTHIVIKTRQATYWYDPAAGGFSSIIDKFGNDWIAYADEPTGEYPVGAASTYRGLPNMVFRGTDDGAGHPGFQQCSSKHIGNQIFTETTSGNWAWNLTFYADYVRLEVTKVPINYPYWFLYEGPAGGSYLPKQTVWGTDQSGPNYDRFDHYKGSEHYGQYQWFYFTTLLAQNTFWMAQLDADTLDDHYSLLGNSPKGIDSNDGMVVAGFGREVDTEALLDSPNVFLLGFYKKPVVKPGRHRAISRWIRKRLNRD